MDVENTNDKHIYIFTNIINKIEAEASTFENLELEKQTSLVDELLLAIDFGFLDHNSPLFKLAIRRLNKILEIYSLDIQQYSELKKIILRALSTDDCNEFKLFLNCYNLKGLKNINEKIIISDIETVTCLLIKQELLEDALLASKILIKYVNNSIEKNSNKKHEIINQFFEVETFILSMASRTNNKVVFVKNIENITDLLNNANVINSETKKSFQYFMINVLFFSADKNWVGIFKTIEPIMTKISWKNNAFLEVSRKIIYEWVQIISMLIIRKWNELQQEFLLGLIKFSSRCAKVNEEFSNLMISKLLMMQVSKDGFETALVCFKDWFVFVSLKFDLMLKKQMKNNKQEIICSSNKYVEFLYNFFCFAKKMDIKYDETIVVKLWYEFWSDLKIKKTVYYRIDALTKITINYWLILHATPKESQFEEKAYMKKILETTAYEEKYKYLIYDRSNVKL